MPNTQIDETFQSIIRRVRETSAKIEHELVNPQSVNGMQLSTRRNTPDLTKNFTAYDLLQGNNIEFISHAYRILLRRNIDEVGLKTYLMQLKTGASRLLMIHVLQHSPEGQAQGEHITFWGLPRTLIRLYTLFDSNQKGQLSFIKRILRKIPATLLSLYERKHLPKQPLFLLHQHVQHQLTQQFNTLRHELKQQAQEQTVRLQQQAQEQTVRLQQQERMQITQLQQHKEAVTVLEKELSNHHRALDALNHEINAVLLPKLDAQAHHLADQQQRISLTRQDTLYQQYHLRQLLTEIKGELPTLTPDDAARYLDEDLNTYYIAFEDTNRGTLADIRQKLSIYLPYITAFSDISVTFPVVDIGCGRCEWLGLLKEAGINAYGIEINGTMATLGQEQGFVVHHNDALNHLKQLPSQSLAAITSFHVIEHLPFALLFALLIEIRRVLVPNGVLIFETPNPENVLVGSHTFYHDFTHRNPITPSALTFLLTYHDFQQLELLRLHPYPETAKVPGHDPLTERVNGHLCGPQDFAVIAYQSTQGAPQEID